MARRRPLRPGNRGARVPGAARQPRRPASGRAAGGPRRPGGDRDQPGKHHGQARRDGDAGAPRRRPAPPAVPEHGGGDHRHRREQHRHRDQGGAPRQPQQPAPRRPSHGMVRIRGTMAAHCRYPITLATRSLHHTPHRKCMIHSLRPSYVISARNARKMPGGSRLSLVSCTTTAAFRVCPRATRAPRPPRFAFVYGPLVPTTAAFRVCPRATRAPRPPRFAFVSVRPFRLRQDIRVSTPRPPRDFY